jgi:hypothetical protein
MKDVARGDVSELEVPEINSLLLVLFGSGDEPLVSPALHQMALSLMDIPSGIAKCERLIVWVFSLPIETYTTIDVLAQAYGHKKGIDRERLVVAMTELLFPNSIDIVKERHFVSVLLLCAIWLFDLPPRPGVELRVFGETLVLFDGDLEITAQGPLNVAIDETWPYLPPNDFAMVFVNFARPVELPRQPVPPEWTKLSETVARAKQELGEYLPSTDQILDFDFQALFV